MAVKRMIDRAAAVAVLDPRLQEERVHPVGVEAIFEEVRDLGISIPALNASDLPLQIAQNGQPVNVTEATFSYRGPTTTLRVGVAWKHTSPLNFDDGDHIISTPHSGWGLSPFLGVKESADFIAYRFTFNRGFFDLLAPALGDNRTRAGQLIQVGSERQIDTWVWIYDPAETGSVFGPGADQTYLVIDTDANVIRMHKAVGLEAGRNLNVRYAL